MTQVDGNTLGVSRWWSACWIGFVTGIERVERVVARVLGTNPERSAVYKTELIVGKVDMLETLAHKRIAINLVYVTVAQVECNNIIIGIAERSQDLDKRIMTYVERR